MRHLKSGRKLGRSASHRRAMFRNMVTSLITSGRVTTTDAKAKEIRRVAERIANFKRRRLLTLDAVGVDAVHHFHCAIGAQLAHDGQRVIKIAGHLQRGRAVHQRLRELAASDFALGDEHHAFHLRARRISGGGSAGVAGAGAGNHLHAARLSFGDGHGHATILERRGGIEPFVFQIQIKRTADGLHEIGHANERRVALVQTDDGRFRPHREMLAIAANDAPPTGCIFVFTAHLYINQNVPRESSWVFSRRQVCQSP